MPIPDDVIEAIRKYFWKGYSYKLIHYLIEKEHGHQLSFQYLQRKVIPRLGLARRGRGVLEDEDEIRNLIENEVNNGCTGYENVRRTLKIKYSKNVKRNTVRQIVHQVDREGVERRKRRRLRRRKYASKGPNYVWHLDGYDKLAQYGIYIHGCIDGFSRYILWCHASITKRSELVASHFLKAVVEQEGVPVKVRADPGTENTITAAIQATLRNDIDAFHYGPSTANQRIERWWGYLRQSCTDFWINHFKILESEGHIDKKNRIHILCIQYIYIPVIKKSLNETVTLWNSHTIRQQRLGDVISGIPEILYRNCELYGTENYKKDVDMGRVRDLINLAPEQLFDIDNNFIQVADEVFQYYEVQNHAENCDDALDMYLILKEGMEFLMSN